MPVNPPTLTEAQIYTENAVAFLRRGLFAELRPKSPSWASWKAYFRSIDHAPMLRIMAAHEDHTWLGKHGITVPTEWPSDFDERAETLSPTSGESERIESVEHRRNVVRMALQNTGFVPKEYRNSRPVAPHELVGEMRDRRQKEIEAAMARVKQIACEPMPRLSDTAKAAAGFSTAQMQAAE